MVDVISKDKCTGCKMCGDLCPQNAIYFESDKEGFWYPKIDEKKCNGCGLCEYVSWKDGCLSQNR